MAAGGAGAAGDDADAGLPEPQIIGGGNRARAGIPTRSAGNRVRRGAINVTVEYRWAEGRYDRLPALANELVDRHAAVIVTTGGGQPARAVLAATSTIPLVFASGSDPVAEGLVKRFDRPDSNATGVHAFTASLGPKRLQLLREVVPNARTIAFLVNPSSQIAEMQMTQMREIARSIGQAIMIFNASTENEIDLAFATLVQRGAGALLMSADTFFQVRREQLCRSPRGPRDVRVA